MQANLRQVVIIVAVLNLAYFGVEFAIAGAIGSVSLFADSVDFLEDASVNFLIAIALGWNATNRARLGMALAGILLRCRRSSSYMSRKRGDHECDTDTYYHS